MSTIDWNFITQTLNRNNSYNIFIDKFLKTYDEAFRLSKTTIKKKPQLVLGLQIISKLLEKS